jgi:cation diffusion facilitator family transporter
MSGTDNERRPGGLSGMLIGPILARSDWPESTRKTELGKLQGATSAIVSLALASLKAVLAIFSGSISLLADALNNFGDLAGSLVLIFGYRLSQKPRDDDHPYGHGRLRTVAGLILAIILIVVGVEAAKSGVMRIVDPQPVSADAWILAAIFVSILVKCWMALFARRIARLTDDAALASEAWNHFFDIFSTGLVLLALFGARHGMPAIDGWAGIGISVFIIYAGASYVRETANILIGTAPSQEDLDEVRRLALGFEEVESVHDVQIHDYGNMRLITLHVEMDAAATAIACHKLTERVEDAISAHFDAKVIVHGDPVDLSHPDYKALARALNSLVADTRDFVDFHDLRIAGARPQLKVEVDLVTRTAVASRDFSAKADQAADFLRARLAGVGQLQIGIETSYASDPEYRKSYPE